MAAFVRENTAVNATGATNITHTVTTPATGNILLLTTSVANTTGTSATPSGVATTWTQLGIVTETNGLVALTTEVWLGLGPFSGTTVTVQKGASGTAGSIEFSGTDTAQRGAAGTAHAAASGQDTSSGPAQAATAVGDLLFVGIGWRNPVATATGPADSYNATTGLVTGARGNPSVKAAYQIAADTSSHTATYTHTPAGGTNSSAAVGVIFGPPPSLPPSHFGRQAVNRAATY